MPTYAYSGQCFYNCSKIIPMFFTSTFTNSITKYICEFQGNLVQKDNLKIEDSDGVSIESLYNNEWALKNRKIDCKSTISNGYFDLL